MNTKSLSIFVQRASECLTDYESHGDGLICFSLLNGLAEWGHTVYAYANSAPIRECNSRLHVKTARHRIPANSLAAWEHSWRAERWLKQVTSTVEIDLVWRMHPYGLGCPSPPQTFGRPLVIGPLFYDWPESASATTGQPRLGVGIAPLVEPAGRRGWERALRQAALILCATEPMTEQYRHQYPQARVEHLPVIVEPPLGRQARLPRMPGDALRLLFVANLLPNKNPQIFCETVQRLREAGINAEGIVLGDGPERTALEAFCRLRGLKNAVEFRGKVPNVDVYAAVGEADFLLSTSVGEPYGRGIAEAMAMGTPCVCHRSGGPADFITDGSDGLLVADMTAAAYADAIACARQEPAAWDRLSVNALHTAHNWRKDAVLTQLEETLYQVVQSSERICEAE